MTIRICIDARIQPGTVGGVEQVILGFAGGFAHIELGDVQISFLTNRAMEEQLRPLFKGHPNLFCHILDKSEKFKVSSPMDRLLGERFSQGLQYILYKLVGNRLIRVPQGSDVVTEDFDLFHFPVQSAFWTSKPNIYHPHDLQYIHLPQFFSRLTCQVLDFKYRSFCEQATAVAVTSTWIKEDVVENYGLQTDKVRVVPLAPPTQHYEVPDLKLLEETKLKLGLPDKYVFYPAQTWPHKNHLNLIRAVARIKAEHGYAVPLVFSGKLTPFKDEIQTEIDKLDLGGAVQFLGFVSSLELQVLYRLCTAVVIPSLYEAASFPLWEAYLAGAATACAATTSLPRQAGDASIVFDPNNIEEIGQAVHRLWFDDDLRSSLIAKGQKRLEQFNWELTCSHFLALYRQILGHELSQAERDLLAREPPL